MIKRISSIYHKGAGDSTVKDPIITSDTCDEYDVLCNYPLGPNEAGHEYLKMIKQEWNSTQTIQTADLNKLSVFKGDYDVVLYNGDGDIIEETAVQVGDSCEIRPELHFTAFIKILRMGKFVKVSSKKPD